MNKTDILNNFSWKDTYLLELTYDRHKNHNIVFCRIKKSLIAISPVPRE